MNEKIKQYLDGVFAPYDGVKSAAELKADLLSDLQERFLELKAEGKDDETAFQRTIDSIGDIEQTVMEIASVSRALEREVLINLSASNLAQSDLAGVTARNGKFNASAMRGSDFSGAALTGSAFKSSDLRDANFSGADLTGSTFKTSDLRNANFDGANLTDCSLVTSDLSGASFNKAILVRTNFGMSGLSGATFSGVRLLGCQARYDRPDKNMLRELQLRRRGLQEFRHAGPLPGWDDLYRRQV